jgi:hypothetical protein
MREKKGTGPYGKGRVVKAGNWGRTKYYPNGKGGYSKRRPKKRK